MAGTWPRGEDSGLSAPLLALKNRRCERKRFPSKQVSAGNNEEQPRLRLRKGWGRLGPKEQLRAGTCVMRALPPPPSEQQCWGALNLQSSCQHKPVHRGRNELTEI